jgi:hypothetical protein
MRNIFVIALIISVTFFLAKFIEMRFIEKESKPLKDLIRDSILVYFSVLLANFIIEQLNPLMNGGSNAVKNTPIFTDNPGF